MARLYIAIGFDRADLDAYARDVLAIFERYGDEPAPHNRAAFDREMARCDDVLFKCLQAIEAPSERRSEAQAPFAWPWEK